jgi:hypothetical protein
MPKEEKSMPKEEPKPIEEKALEEKITSDDLEAPEKFMGTQELQDEGKAALEA